MCLWPGNDDHLVFAHAPCSAVKLALCGFADEEVDLGIELDALEIPLVALQHHEKSAEGDVDSTASVSGQRRLDQLSKNTGAHTLTDGAFS